MKLYIIIAIGFLLVSSYKLFGQDDFFHEIEIKKEFYDSDEWTFEAASNWKHIYDEVGWRRWSIDAIVKRKLDNWAISGGIVNYFTFNEDIYNCFEVRPHLSVQLKTPVVNKFTFLQQLRSEWRTFIYTQGNSKNESYGRLRYKIGGLYTLSEKKELETAWKVRGDIEWYFLKDPTIGERFPNSRQYTLKVIREFKAGKELSFGYKLEYFYKNVQNKDGNGHTLILGYGF